MFVLGLAVGVFLISTIGWFVTKKTHAHSKHKHKWTKWSPPFTDMHGMRVCERFCKKCRLPERRMAHPK